MSTRASMHGTLRQRFRYRLDNFLARGSGALFVSLLVAFLAAIVAIGAGRFLLHAVAPEATSVLSRELWVVFLQLTDPGNMGEDSDNPPVLKSAAVVAGLTGVVIFSALIAFLTTALDQAIAHLKKGHSQVLESGHTLILGWGPRVVEMLRELVEANASEKDPVVVILSEEDKEEMDEYLRSHFTDRRNTRVVTRSGPTGSVQSLRRVSAPRAKSAIVLANCTHSATLEVKLGSDARVIKTVLALESLLTADQEFAIVAEAFTDRNRQVLKDIAPGKVNAIDVEEILGEDHGANLAHQRPRGRLFGATGLLRLRDVLPQRSALERPEVRPAPVPLPRRNTHRHPAERRRDRHPPARRDHPRARRRDCHHRRGRLLHRLPAEPGHDSEGA